MNTSERALFFLGLEKRYPGFTLGPLDFELAPGTVVGLVGPNGAGKTTTLHCAAGLVNPEQGIVEIFGQINRPGDTAWKQDVGFVGEDQGFYRRWSAERNLRAISRFRPGWSTERVGSLVDRFELPLTTRFMDLSKGNRTKLALIAALAHGPRLLLLDEPTSGLDPLVRSEVLDVLWEILEDGDATILYSTHILSDISRLADELIFLHEGQVLQRSAKEDLSESWRRISFRLDQDEDLILQGAVEHRHEQREHQVITSDHGSTLRQLSELGAENIQESRMTIDEIAVEILRGTHHVETH